MGLSVERYVIRRDEALRTMFRWCKNYLRMEDCRTSPVGVCENIDYRSCEMMASLVCRPIFLRAYLQRGTRDLCLNPSEHADASGTIAPKLRVMRLRFHDGPR